MAEPFRARQSDLATFSRCPLSCHFELEAGERYSPELIRGTLAHRVQAECLKTMRKQGATKIPQEEAIQVMYEVCAQIGTPSEEVIVLTAEERLNLRQFVIRWASDYEWDVRRILHLEEQLTKEIKCEDGIVRILTGTPDVVFAAPPDGLVVEDSKSGWQPPKTPRDADPQQPRRYLTERGHYQLDAYSLLAMHAHPRAQHATFREIHPRAGEERSATLRRDEMDEVERLIGIDLMLMDRAISEGPDSPIWRPVPGVQCLAGDTRFLTEEGVRTLADACGESVRVLDKHGEWVEATVEYFGHQPLLRVEFDRGETVDATPDHRWWTLGPRDPYTGNFPLSGERVTTVELSRAPVTRHATLPELDPEGVRHGIVYGDGYVNRGWSRVRLQPHKAELARYFDSGSVWRAGRECWPVKQRDIGIVDVTLQPPHYKTLPAQCSPAYARGFIAGLIATDGRVDPQGGVEISQEGLAKAEGIAEVSRLGGAVVSSVLVASREWPERMPQGTITKGRVRELCSIRLKPATAPVVRSDHAVRLKAKNQMRRMYRDVVSVSELGVQPVYCAVVPGSESFTLANGLITSNCRWCIKRSACPRASDERGAGAIESDDMARDYAERIEAVTPLRTELIDAAKAWVDANGPIPLPDGRVLSWNVKPSGSRRFEAHVPEPPTEDETEYVNQFEESIRVLREAAKA